MILALDTATEMLGLALHDGDTLLWESTWAAPLRHTVALGPLVHLALETAGLSPKEVRAVAVALGPGSYTALRVGLAFAKGFALVHNIPVIGVPTLDIQVRAHPGSKSPLVSVLRAGRGRVAAAAFAWHEGAWRADTVPQGFTWETLAEWVPKGAVLCGELGREGRAALHHRRDVHLLPAAACLRRAGYLAEIAWQRLQAGEDTGPAELAPLYLDAHHG